MELKNLENMYQSIKDLQEETNVLHEQNKKRRKELFKDSWEKMFEDIAPLRKYLMFLYRNTDIPEMFETENENFLTLGLSCTDDKLKIKYFDNDSSPSILPCAEITKEEPLAVFSVASAVQCQISQDIYNTFVRRILPNWNKAYEEILSKLYKELESRQAGTQKEYEAQKTWYESLEIKEEENE